MTDIEYRLFDEVFYQPSARQEHVLSKRATMIKYPVYRQWQEFVECHNIMCAKIDPTQVYPQKVSAREVYGLDERSAMVRPMLGTTLFNVLTENINSDRYVNIIHRIMEFINVAYDIYHDDRPWSLPSITLYEPEPELHPGNRLTTATEIENSKNISIYSPHIEDYFDTSELSSMTQLEQLFKQVNQYYKGNNSVTDMYNLSSDIIPNAVNMYKIISELKREIHSLRAELDSIREKS